MIDSLGFLFNAAPSYMIFWVTQNCNAHCEFCFNWEENLKKNNDLTIDEIERLTSRYPRLHYLTLAGGEPTLRTDLPAVVDCFVRNSKLQFLTLVTNAIRWKSALAQIREILEAHPKLNVNVGVSIDYIGEAHDKSRKVSGCYEACIRLVEELKKLASVHPRLVVIAVGTLTRDNRDTIVQTARHLAERHGIPYAVNLVRGRVENNDLKEVSIEAYREIVREVARIRDGVMSGGGVLHPFLIALEEMASENIYRSARDGECQSTCQSGRKAVVLESNGMLRLCEILPDTFGNVRDHDYDIPAMLRRPEAKAVVRRIVEGRCHCTWECINRANVAYDFRKYPRLFVNGLVKTAVMSRNAKPAPALSAPSPGEPIP